MRQILEKCCEQNTDVRRLFDFQAAYNTVWGKEMWREMHKLGFSTKNVVKFCRILNNEIYVKVKTGK